VAVKDRRIRVYHLVERGQDGATDQVYLRQPSGQSDQGYWAGTPYISGRERTVGTQAEHVVIYDVVMDDHVPVVNSSDAVIAVLGNGTDEVQFLKVRSVGLLTITGEKIARTEDVSDEDWPSRLVSE
jgi:hypothetical protein